ncbi:hypothetical protein [Sulfuricella sp.]|uniref:hypothetical protein n=1 Tax=Sulfuricella sp. TaxID=2099377 RepID=UPI002C74611E|nr:hypothetical protein [Sulfuricella sp.]HUX63160.1 hypothetical protein [Sulfuricella sp.]
MAGFRLKLLLEEPETIVVYASYPDRRDSNRFARTASRPEVRQVQGLRPRQVMENHTCLGGEGNARLVRPEVLGRQLLAQP